MTSQTGGAGFPFQPESALWETEEQRQRRRASPLLMVQWDNHENDDIGRLKIPLLHRFRLRIHAPTSKITPPAPAPAACEAARQ